MPETSKNRRTLTLSSEELHSMRNQLNVVLGYAQILEDEETLCTDHKKMLQTIADSALTMRSTLFQKPQQPAEEFNVLTEPAPNEPTSLPKNRSLKNGANGSAQKILIVDDKEENLTLFKEILLPYHYDIYTASSGLEALKQMATIKPELILLDVVMPEMDGYEVLKKLKNDTMYRDIPVIFLTANDAAEDIVQGLESGAIDYIAKPFHPKELIARVHTHMEKGRLFANIKRLMEHSFHELYTPLSVISFAMQLQELEHAKTEYTTMTRAASRSLQNIYDDLYYSINYAQKRCDPTRFDLSRLLQDRTDYFTLIAHSKQLDFQTDFITPAMVYLNAQDIERIIDNLLSNAIKYTKGAEPIKLTLETNAEEFLFKICNPVQKKVDLDKIFKKYYRHEEEVFGLGLGLELVQSLCEQNRLKLKATQEDHIFCIEITFRKAS